MAYMSQEKKKEIAKKLKVVMQGTGIKYSLGVRNHSTLVMNITSGPLDFIQNYIDVVSQTPRVLSMPHMFQAPKDYMDVNPYHYQDQYSGKVLALFKKVFPILNDGNHDNSDIMTDYFDVGWYVDVNIGKWDKPYQLVK